MIHITEDHYAAIGRMAVESCTLDREVGEYLTRLGSPPHPRSMIGRKLTLFQETLQSQRLVCIAETEFETEIEKLRKLISFRNSLAHGVWVPKASSIGKPASVAHGESASIHASEVAAVAAQLRVARKLLLRLCHDHVPLAVGQKKKNLHYLCHLGAKTVSAVRSANYHFHREGRPRDSALGRL